MNVIRLAQMNGDISTVRSNITRVSMGTTMAVARVIRKMPIMKPMMRRAGNAMQSS